jgi:glycerophosphoryl diester phosphodiesterase
MIEIIGHRGYAARAPENTLASLELALDAGADSVEWDVQVAACGTPVLFHDATLERTTDGSGAVRSVTFDELSRLDAGRWFDDAFAGEPVPSLAGALDAVKGRAARVYCEVKACRGVEDLHRMVDLVRERGMLETVVFISLDWRFVETVAEYEPTGRLGLVLHDARRSEEAWRTLERLGRGFLDAEAGLLLNDPSVVERSLDLAFEVGAWTVNDAGAATPLADMGVTRLTTDEVESLVEWREARSAR